jgi:ATP phosphoribosyltransferase
MLALPSKGALAEPTLAFFAECGLRVEKPNPRQYVGHMPALPQVDVLFQRVVDVVYKVADGTAQIGVTGYDNVVELPHEDLVVVQSDLRYGACDLVVAVPETWVDVESMYDLVEIAHDFRETRRRDLRIATTYPNATRAFLRAQGIHHFTLVGAEGAIEAAPTIGYADIIVDLVQTGTTLRENHLKPLPDGVIIESQACLVANRRTLHEQPTVLDTLRTMLEQMDATIHGRAYSQITVNMQGESAEAVALRVAQNELTRGLQGPTVAPIYGGHLEHGTRWYTISVIVPNRQLMAAVRYLRSIGGTQATVIPVRYVFHTESESVQRLNRLLHG